MIVLYWQNHFSFHWECSILLQLLPCCYRGTVFRLSWSNVTKTAGYIT